MMPEKPKEWNAVLVLSGAPVLSRQHSKGGLCKLTVYELKTDLVKCTAKTVSYTTSQWTVKRTFKEGGCLKQVNYQLKLMFEITKFWSLQVAT